ncbi:hypothetical protein ACWN8V_13275 [Vagococcus elongatus]|uniref:Uncharacterized protein n=1 Tax=Vagococcus elongatus TaxID=180344 RepID=A0A430AL95_9ENTE|nr:hypothetical protein [Vagococcus elongatus]RSU08878.1 hypothetical protein CBF29_13045 [Vagococcus elongatus]
MKNNQNKFLKVSAFSPNVPLKYRWNSLLFVIFAEMGSVIWLESHIQNGFLFILVLIGLFCLMIYTTYKFVTNRKRGWVTSPYKLLRRFIMDNNLFESGYRIIGQDNNGNDRKKNVIIDIVYMLYLNTPEKLGFKSISWTRFGRLFSKECHCECVIVSLSPQAKIA